VKVNQLGHIAHLLTHDRAVLLDGIAQHLRFALKAQQPQQTAQHGGLARTIRSPKRQRFTLAHLKMEMVDRYQPTEPTGQAFHPK
jgi:hypothetical protein